MPEPEHVVFVSYATVDNHPHPSGWVSAFVKSLDENLHAQFGFKDDNRIWWDRKNINEEKPLTEQIRRKARESQCMVIVFSRGYLSSRWCREEREAFLAAAKDNPELQSSLFLIDIGNVKIAERPTEFQDKKGRDFWVQADGSDRPGDRVPAGHPLPDPENRDHTVFYTRISSLARAIRDRVCSEKSIPPINSGTTVFVAEATDDVGDQREEVVEFLSDHFSVVPGVNDPLPQKWELWKPFVESVLAPASVFVQILGALPGTKLPGSDFRPVLAQYDIAKAAGKRILHWRPKELSPDSAKDSRLRDLLTHAEFSGPLEAFKTEVKRIATPAPPDDEETPLSPGEMAQPSVFIDTAENDSDEAARLAAILKALNCRCSWVPKMDSAGELRKFLMKQLCRCDGLIFLFGKAQPTWLFEQFNFLERAIPRRIDNPLRGLAVCVRSPRTRTDVTIDWPNMDVISGLPDISVETMLPWVERLRTRSLG